MERREFITKSTILTAAGLAGITMFSCKPQNKPTKGMRVPGPNDTINLGFVGLGMRFNQLFNEFKKIEGLKILAVSDIDDKRIEKATLMVNNHNGPQENTCDSYKDFRELITRDDIDGVVIATPDHWHAIITVMAIKEGKDVYCEKPVTHTIAEGRAVVDAASKYERIVQVGSQQRSHKAFRDAVNYVRNGYIGDVHTVKEMSSDKFPVSFNQKTVEPPKYMDWNMWMGPSEYFDYNELLLPDVSIRNFPAWRRFREWGGGGIADLGAHMYDIAQWGLDMDMSGPIEVLLPGDGAETLTFKYANGVVMKKEDFGMGGMSIMFEGSEGWVAAGRWWMKTCDKLKDVKLEEKNGFVYESKNHYKDWIDCMRNRKQPICNSEVGHRTSTICNMANIAEQKGKSLQWDPVKEAFNSNSANRLKSYRYRGKWSI
ncbi:MAG: Gfo/Idh/MocA family oxidoreductase [Bacteroidetes bacterium]|nr:Gfo/Idh/MocA family oxidoreductase [Bacteroidota bacterium]